MAQEYPTILTAGRTDQRTERLERLGQLFHSLRGKLTDTCTPRSSTQRAPSLIPKNQVRDREPVLHRG